VYLQSADAAGKAVKHTCARNGHLHVHGACGLKLGENDAERQATMMDFRKEVHGHTKIADQNEFVLGMMSKHSLVTFDEVRIGITDNGNIALKYFIFGRQVRVWSHSTLPNQSWHFVNI
jgi:hypothetical protein